MNMRMETKPSGILKKNTPNYKDGCQIVKRASQREVLQLYTEKNAIAHFLSNF